MNKIRLFSLLAVDRCVVLANLAFRDAWPGDVDGVQVETTLEELFSSYPDLRCSATIETVKEWSVDRRLNRPMLVGELLVHYISDGIVRLLGSAYPIDTAMDIFDAVGHLWFRTPGDHDWERISQLDVPVIDSDNPALALEFGIQSELVERLDLDEDVSISELRELGRESSARLFPLVGDVVRFGIR